MKNKLAGMLTLIAGVTLTSTAFADIYSSRCSEGDSASTGSCASVAVLCEPVGGDRLIDRVTVSYSSARSDASVQMTSFKVPSVEEYTDDFAAITSNGKRGQFVSPAHTPTEDQGILDFSIPLGAKSAGWIEIRDVKFAPNLILSKQGRKIKLACVGL